MRGHKSHTIWNFACFFHVEYRKILFQLFLFAQKLFYKHWEKNPSSRSEKWNLILHFEKNNFEHMQTNYFKLLLRRMKNKIARFDILSNWTSKRETQRQFYFIFPWHERTLLDTYLLKNNCYFDFKILNLILKYQFQQNQYTHILIDQR